MWRIAPTTPSRKPLSTCPVNSRMAADSASGASCATRCPTPSSRTEVTLPVVTWRKGTDGWRAVDGPLALAPDTPNADTRIGYARCSTLTQELQSQLDALAKHGIPRDKVFSEKISTRLKVRPELAEDIARRRETLAHDP